VGEEKVIIVLPADPPIFPLLGKLGVRFKRAVVVYGDGNLAKVFQKRAIFIARSEGQKYFTARRSKRKKRKGGGKQK